MIKAGNWLFLVWNWEGQYLRLGRFRWYRPGRGVGAILKPGESPWSFFKQATRR